MKKIKKMIEDVLSVLRTNIFLFKYVFSRKNEKKYALIRGIRIIINTIIPLITTIFPGLIINELVYGEEANFNKLILYIAVLLLIPAINQLFGLATDKYISIISQKIYLDISTEFFEHISQLDIEFREDPDILTKEHIARETLTNATSSIDLFYNVISCVFSVVALSSIISALHPFVLTIIVLNIIISTYVNKKASDRQNAMIYDHYKLERYINAYETPLIHVHFAREVSLFGTLKFFTDKFIEYQKKADSSDIERAGHGRKASLIISILNIIQECIFYGYMVLQVVIGKMPVGNISIFTGAVHQFSGSLSNLFNQYVELAGRNQSITDTIEYLNMPLMKMRSGDLTPVIDSESYIEFKNVYFKYPRSENYVLKDINIKFKLNQRICIVGDNGAGKTTFIKLLIRMYRPTRGEILLNGINIYEYDYKEYWRLFSPVFQDYELYGGLTFRENIVLADDFEQEKFNEICTNNSLDGFIGKLPKGTDNMIDDWIDEKGIVPSGGEKQRIFIARACYHGGDIYILDEPTAALDPISEYNIYAQFNNMIADKCALLITHRLSAVQLSDKVAVFKEGQIIEYGTHKELYANGGTYTEMFDKQAQFYRDEITHNDK